MGPIFHPSRPPSEVTPRAPSPLTWGGVLKVAIHAPFLLQQRGPVGGVLQAPPSLTWGAPSEGALRPHSALAWGGPLRGTLRAPLILTWGGGTPGSPPGPFRPHMGGGHPRGPSGPLPFPHGGRFSFRLARALPCPSFRRLRNDCAFDSDADDAASPGPARQRAVRLTSRCDRLERGAWRRGGRRQHLCQRFGVVIHCGARPRARRCA